ncbi:uncharacterized protein PHACADRAFT_260189 [Phanerochaete carnosa HHB-10118-sp]|uniref:Uncharacterized protein n=1 Tax=Phanerochaete carnosa (strain HHB-10118-sp) TaxID=650164 RepID=K5WTE4_PHACS|nr:uncharacterized protein PHACADRAFT_260189 [Phanerochaete carnosa HHB-10118-sp]EKM53702.1 hypothetical protein PHACADRAFT_260189 [Phanerochaete carnosa HHB-10118-sp]
MQIAREKGEGEEEGVRHGTKRVGLESGRESSEKQRAKRLPSRFNGRPRFDEIQHPETAPLRVSVSSSESPSKRVQSAFKANFEHP